VNEAENHVIEHALRELLSEETTDLPQRVLQAWRSSAPLAAPTDRLASKRSKLPHLIAAAVLLIAAVLIFQLGFRDEHALSDSLVIATSERPLGVLVQGDAYERTQSSFRVGDTLVNGPLHESELALSDGDSITLGRCSMLAFQRDRSGLLIEPRLGRVTLHASDGSPVRVHTSLGTVTLDSPGELQVDVLAEGYDLEHPELFQQLSKDIHMKTAALPLILTAVTLVEGTALLETSAGVRRLESGATLREQEDGVSSAAVKAKLLEEVGTWDLTVTDVGPSDTPVKPFSGVEVIVAGPGDEWLITDMTVTRGQQAISLHTVIGYDRRHRSYTGSLVDSFGGEMGLIKGTPESDLATRTLNMFSVRSTPGFDVRWRMTWDNPNQRRTEMEVLQGETWVLQREILHERRQ